MREWTSPPRVSATRNHDCMAVFFMGTGVLVFGAALLCALGFINLVP